MKKLKMCWDRLYQYGSSEMLPHGHPRGEECNVWDSCDHSKPHTCRANTKGWEECTCELIEQDINNKETI